MGHENAKGNNRLGRTDDNAAKKKQIRSRLITTIDGKREPATMQREIAWGSSMAE